MELHNSDKIMDLFERMSAQEKEALAFGFYWANHEQLLEQIRSECNEIQEALLQKDRTHLQEEIGDLINAAVSLCIFANFDPYETALKGVEKIQKRYDILVSKVKEDGLVNLRGKSVDEQLIYWEKAKQLVSKE